MTDEKYPLALPQGSVLAGQYIIEKVLGQGGFGITYKAQDHKSGQEVAIKEFFPDSMVTRTRTAVTAFAGERAESFAYGKACFQQEAETLAEFIGNENIVRVHSYFEENQTAYFVMDFVEGISFDRYIKEHGGRVSYEEAEKILLPVIDALAAVHRRGIVHRDVTPDNIYITDKGTVKLLDFGAARYSLGDKSRSLDVVLKHGFAPKEQYTRRGKQGPFTDVYTLGASLYFAITGRRPPDSIDRMEEDELIPPGNLGVSIPENKEEAILKAMSVQPSERFQTMEAFKQALMGETAPQSAVRQKSEETPPPVMPQPEPASVPQQPSAPQTEKKKQLLWAGIGAGAAAVIAIVAVAVFSGNKAKPADNTNNNKMAHYDLLEDANDNSGDPVDNFSEKNEPNVNQDSMPDYQPPVELEIGTPFTDTIQGNTPNNIAQYGQIAAYNNGVALAYPGGNGLVYIDDDARYLDDTGYVRCISIIDDTVYYINTGTAYCVNRDGTNKQKIPQLESYDTIATLYVSDQYFYIFKNDDVGLYCIDRNSGALLGTVACDGSEGLTFLNGNLYYLFTEDSSKLYKLPADNFGAQPELLLDFEKIGKCRELASDGNYIYGLYSDQIEGSTSFFQYNAVKEEIYGKYDFYKESWPGDFSALNVADQYIYFIYSYEDAEEDICIPNVCRFKADMDANKDQIEVVLVYEGTFGQHFKYLSLLKDTQLMSVCSWGNCNEIIVADVNGESEPVIIDDRDMESNE